MKIQEEIEELGSKYATTHEDVSDKLSKYLVSACFQDGYVQCQEDTVQDIQSLIDIYNLEIIELEEEFRDSCSVLTLEKMSTIKRVVTNLESKIKK